MSASDDASRVELRYGCGHRGTVDLSALTPGRRAGRRRYLSESGLCPDCYATTRWGRRAGYAPLIGAVREAALGERARLQLLTALRGWAVERGHDPSGYARVEPTAKAIQSARWWLDRRAADIAPAALIAALDAVASGGSGPSS